MGIGARRPQGKLSQGLFKAIESSVMAYGMGWRTATSYTCSVQVRAVQSGKKRGTEVWGGSQPQHEARPVILDGRGGVASANGDDGRLGEI